MKRRNVNMAAATILTAAMLLTGCGAAAENTKESQTSKAQTEAQTSAAETASGQTQAPQTETQAAQTEAQPNVEASDTEQPVDNPAADSGEGDTNGFYDDAGTWVTVYKNSSGQWVDESGMVYQFGDEGVTDQNGVFYPY